MRHLDELLSAHLDGETDQAESRRVGAHLAECLRCRRRLVHLQEARAAVRSLPHLQMPPELVPVAESRPGSRRPLWLGAAAAAAAALIAVASLSGPDPEPIDLSDLSRQIGARAALDSGAGSIKVVMPGEVVE